MRVGDRTVTVGAVLGGGVGLRDVTGEADEPCGPGFLASLPLVAVDVPAGLAELVVSAAAG